jgi:hypothetical protein
MNSSNNIQNISQFIEVIKAFEGQIDNRPSHNFVFRGQADGSKDLLPKIYRAEYSDLRPSDEKAIIRRFTQQACQYVTDANPDADYLRWMGYAQHFCVPTRLLDWSLNPLIAL